MKKILPLFTVAALGFSANLAQAKGKKDERTTGTYGCAKFDVNQNGVLDPEEIAELRKAFASGDTALKPLDVNNDGKLDDQEVAAIKIPQAAGKGKKKKKKE